jgi:purine-binding chemotaxis protein CheW
MTMVIEAPPGAAPTAVHSDAEPAGPSAPAMAAMPNEFLSVRLGGEEHGIDILRVQEIRSYEPPTRIANTPHLIKGVVNLRGVIVLSVRGRVIGAVVDSVSDVLALDAGSIKPAPTLNASGDAGCIVGIGCVRSGDVERMLILTDIEALMSSTEMGLVEQTLRP